MFALMHAEMSSFTVSRMARLLEVSRSGFYAWSKRSPSMRAVRAERIVAEVTWFHGESDEVSGAPGILADLREDGETISRKAVAETMRRLGLRGICPRRRRTTTQREDGDAYPPDAAKRVWDTGVLNAVWVGDITWLRTWEGQVCLATVITRSMGHTGICWDNAMAESFFATLKTEFYYRRVWPTRAGAGQAVGAWIQDRYNRRRRHSSIGHISPVTFEMQHCNQTAADQKAA